MNITIVKMMPERWDDLVDLFGPERGANGGCWCMWWRTSRAEWQKKDRSGRKAAFKRVVDSGAPVGLLAYDGASAVGWCAVGPRSSLPTLARSRVAKSVASEDEATWFINCFYVRAGYRGHGLMEPLAKAATQLAFQHGASVVEACPIDTGRTLQWGEGFVGLVSVFERLGFTEIARRTPGRPLMRLTRA